MASLASCWTKSSDLPISCNVQPPKPSYHPQNKSCIILTTDYEERRTEPGIYQYNIETNESFLLYKYDQNMDIEHHTQFIDPSNNTLIICAGLNTATAHVFDLNTNTMGQSTAQNTLGECTYFSNPTHIPSPINQIHFFSDEQHCQFDIKTKSVTMNKLDSFSISYPHLLYVASKRKLMAFGSYGKKGIYECNIPQTNNENMQPTPKQNDGVFAQALSMFHYMIEGWQWGGNKIKNKHLKALDLQWMKSEMEMPYSVPYLYDTLLGFENILFVFYFSEKQNKEIHLLDLLNDKWYKSQYCVPEMSNREQNFVMKYNDSAHILDFHSKEHFKVCLYDLIPKELVVSHRKYYKGLIMGYVREKESQLSTQRVPFVLKHLILLYYQIFS